MHVRSKVIDLNNDGRAEIIALKSGIDETYNPRPRELAIYSYTGNSQLTLIDEIEIPMTDGDNLNLLWTQPLIQGGYRVIVPVPEKWVDGMERQRIIEYQSFQVIENQLVKETEPLEFEWEYYDLTTPLDLPLEPRTINDNGSLKTLQIRDGKYLEFVDILPKVFPK